MSKKEQRALLKKISGKSGVYIVTSSLTRKEVKDPEESFLVKIGLAKDLKHRIGSYQLYWPQGVYIHFLVTTAKRKAREVERVLHSYLRDKIRHVERAHTHTQEWAFLSIKDIEKLKSLLEANKKTKYPKGTVVKRSGKKVKLSNKKILPYTEIIPVNMNIAVSITTRVKERVPFLPANIKKLLDSKRVLFGLGSPFKTARKLKKLPARGGVKKIPFQLKNESEEESDEESEEESDEESDELEGLEELEGI